MKALEDAAPSLTATNLADRRWVYSVAGGDLLVSPGIGSDLADFIVADLELRDLGTEGGATVPLPVVRILSRSSGNDVDWIDASRVAAEVPRVTAARGWGAASEQQCSAMQSHLAAVQNDASVAVGPQVKGMQDAFTGGAVRDLLNRRTKPSENRAAFNSPAERVAVLAVPVVVGSAVPEGVVSPGALVQAASPMSHTRIMPCGSSCCLGVPTE